MTQSVLPLPPKPAKDASFPPPPAYEFKAASADESVFASPKAALETCDFAVSGIYSLDGETIEASLYLVEKSGSRFARLGTCTGDIGRLETLVDALASLLIEKLASPAIRVIDLDMVQTDASWEVLPKDSGFALVGKRIFIYKKGNYSIRFGKPAPEGAVIAIEADTGSDRSGPVYNKIQPKLIDDKTLSPNRADGSSGKDPALALKEAARLAAWDGSGQEKAYAAFSRSLSRLIVSVPVSALSLGIFFLGYEAYARSGIDLGGLALRTAPAVISLGCSLGFAIDTGIRIGGLTRSSH